MPFLSTNGGINSQRTPSLTARRSLTRQESYNAFLMKFERFLPSSLVFCACSGQRSARFAETMYGPFTTQRIFLGI